MHAATQSPSALTPFQSEAWAQAWLDTWGNDPRIRLIDLGGRKHPLEQVYITTVYLKKILPIGALCLPGNGAGALSTPRAEYNNIDTLIRMAGDVGTLAKTLRPLKWQQMRITDVEQVKAHQDINELASGMSTRVYLYSQEDSYSIKPVPFQHWVDHLGANTRLAYYNRRQRLAQYGEIGFVDYTWQEFPIFFELLNSFHLARWGCPCYSSDSQRFLQNFCERLIAEGGNPILQAMTVNGKIVSVVFDIVWRSRRYNLQSGYYENHFPKIALGALHFGYAIEASLEQGCAYDFMAGLGKNSNYKERIANHKSKMTSFFLEKNKVSWLRRCAQIINYKKSKIRDQ